MKNLLKKFLVGLAIIFCIGGAVNSGWSYFVPAVPFMVYLLIVAHQHGKRVFYFTLIFVLLCITISLTRDKNPLIYPILWNGEVTILQDGYHIKYSDGSGDFYTKDRALRALSDGMIDDKEKVKVEQFIQSTEGPRSIVIPSGYTYYENNDDTVTRLHRGEKFPVTGVVHSNADLGSYLHVQTEIGNFGSYHDGPVQFDTTEGISINKPVQAKWAEVLSGYPILVLIMTLTNPLLLLVLAVTIILSRVLYKSYQKQKQVPTF